MAHVLADRILETTSSAGLGAYRLQGPRPGYAAFASVMLPGDTCHYTATDNLQWEIGLATLQPDGPSLARTEILRSSRGEGVPIAWPPAPRAILTSRRSAPPARSIGFAAGSACLLLHCCCPRARFAAQWANMALNLRWLIWFFPMAGCCRVHHSS